MARIITKTIEVEERTFVVKKYPAIEGLKIAKVLMAKILPMFQSFMPLIAESQKDGGVSAEKVLANLGDYLSLDSIADTLDKVTPADFEYIMQKSLQSAFEMLPAGEAQVLNNDGTYGVLDVEHDPLLVLRLVCEVVMWGIGDFFDGKRLTSIMSPLSSSFPRTQKT
jgi:hypothetical protein